MNKSLVHGLTGPPAAPSTNRPTLRVLGTPIDATTPAGAVERIAGWAAAGESRYVCICNAHSLVTAARDASVAAALALADMATPDGAPVAWMMRRLGAMGQERISGPDLMLDYFRHAARTGEPIFLYGSAPSTLRLLQVKLRERWPELRIAGAISPPYSSTVLEQNEADLESIAASGARTVWVSLGCPKQELWMAANRGRVPAVMVGVGAAFDFHAGTIERAPMWMQQHGLEWLHRLAQEPRRLWRRYLVTNSSFVLRAAMQLLAKGR